MIIQNKLELSLFYGLLRIRKVEEEIARRYSQQKMRCPVHLSIGQEAIAVGVCHQLTSQDLVVSGHRAHAHYLSKGGNLKRMIAEIYGKKAGCAKGIGGSMHLVDLDAGFLGSTPIVGGSIPIGVGAAFHHVLQNNTKEIVVIFFGEGATEEGVWAESLNFASVQNLPVLFVCENNLYSVYSPLSVRQSKKRDRLGIAKAHGIEGVIGDGNNINEVYKLAQDAVGKVREKRTPFYLELNTYRYVEHCGPNPDDHLRYRPQKEVNFWKNRCPIQLAKEKLCKTDLHSMIEEIETEIQKEIEDAFTFAENASFPTVDKDFYA